MPTTLFGFNGRLARLPYFGFSLLIAAIAVVLCLVGAALVSTHNPAGILVAMIFFLAAAVFMIWTWFALWIKRLHDLDMAGTHTIWMVLLSVAGNLLWSLALHNDGIMVVALLVGLTNWGVALWLLFAPGTPNANRYGPVPGSLAIGPIPSPVLG